MKVIICLTKEDIQTEPCGLHFTVKSPSGFELNFTGEAIEELYADYIKITERKQEMSMTSFAGAMAMKALSKEYPLNHDPA